MALTITGERDLNSDPFLVLKERTFLDRSGATKHWTYVERRSGREAVVVVPVTRDSRSLIVIRQFRIPFGETVVEFPAGLIDQGETPEQAAIRELLEETGFRGSPIRVGPPVSTSAGITTELVYMCFVEAEEERDAQPGVTPESSEEIEVMKIPPTQLGAALARWEAAGELLDIKLYTYLASRWGE